MNRPDLWAELAIEKRRYDANPLCCAGERIALALRRVFPSARFELVPHGRPIVRFADRIDPEASGRLVRLGFFFEHEQGAKR